MKLSAGQIGTYCRLCGRWQLRRIQGQDALYSTTLGSYLRFRLSRPATVTFTAISNGNPAANPQIYAWRINGQSWQRVSVTQMPIRILVRQAGAIVEIMTAGNNDSDQVWTGGQGFAIVSLSCDQGAISPTPARPLLTAIGDSITAGCWVQGKRSSYDYCPESNYLQLLADHCGFDTNRLAYSASGVLAPGTGGVPAAGHWLEQLDATHPVPLQASQLVLVNLGTNDHQPDPQLFTKRLVTILQRVRRQCQAPVLVMMPLSQNNHDLIALAARQSSCRLIDTHNWCHHWTDHTHPNQEGAKEMADHLIPIINKMKGAFSHD